MTIEPLPPHALSPDIKEAVRNLKASAPRLLEGEMNAITERQIAEFANIEVVMKFGDRLRMAMEAEDRSLADVAPYAKTSRQTVSNWLSGTSPARLTTEQFQDLADYLRVRVDWLVSQKGPMRKDAAGAEQSDEKRERLRQIARQFRRALRDLEDLADE